MSENTTTRQYIGIQPRRQLLAMSVGHPNSSGVSSEELGNEGLGFEELGLALASLYSVSYCTGAKIYLWFVEVQSVAEWRDRTQSRR